MTIEERATVMLDWLQDAMDYRSDTSRDSMLGMIENHLRAAAGDEREAILNIIRAHSFEVARVGTSVNALIDTIAARKGRA